eukprot:13846440-Alexandrium_andersonii.AAC.1
MKDRAATVQLASRSPAHAFLCPQQRVQFSHAIESTRSTMLCRGCSAPARADSRVGARAGRLRR